MPNTRPLVTAALLCDDVIIGSDGAATIVRVVDQATVTMPSSLPPGTKPTIKICAFFAVKSGDLHGDYDLTIVVRLPDGKARPARDKWRVHLDGGETGANLKMQLGLPAIPGLWWVDLVWEDGEVLSSTPFKLSEATPAATTPEK